MKERIHLYHLRRPNKSDDKCDIREARYSGGLPAPPCERRPKQQQQQQQSVNVIAFRMKASKTDRLLFCKEHRWGIKKANTRNSYRRGWNVAKDWLYDCTRWDCCGLFLSA
ncbi:hypothetical protein ZHAS_00019066 [Anopheles sinensis]|uniref:Uncharacterized protein n=1 Tax=Anopheles sinensis TaxID=74873 RepID=A0A084WKT0_ANOSI|nr:hypothetical protein ZHAS_00019066 [Anopheles sinensis]